jgi:hypothetical protein
MVCRYQKELWKIWLVYIRTANAGSGCTWRYFYVERLIAPYFEAKDIDG